MAEINIKPTSKNRNLNDLVGQFEKDLMGYLNQEQNSKLWYAKRGETISALENLASRLKIACPEGTTWDPKTRTCKSN